MRSSQSHVVRLDRSQGRVAFGDNPSLYDSIRPAYPQWVYDLVRDRCKVGEGNIVFEIGAGTGIATRPLLDLGVERLTAIEPDARLAPFLRQSTHSSALEIIEAAFDEAVLPVDTYDFGIAATSFHWLNESEALAKIKALLKPGGWWMAVWHVFGDDRPDAFHDATKQFFTTSESPSAGAKGIPFALDGSARISALQLTGFESIDHVETRWELELTADQTVALYSTYSNIACDPRGPEVLAGLRIVAEEEFANRVIRNMVTVAYIAKAP